MISFELGVEDLADTRFALSPLYETVLSLRVLREPGLSALHLPWRRSVLGALDALDGLDGLGGLDTELLMSVVAVRRTLPDFLTPRPTSFAPSFEEELAAVGRTPPTWSAATCWPRTTRTRSPPRCSPPSLPTTGPSSPSATTSARCCAGTGRSPSSRCGRGCASCWRPT